MVYSNKVYISKVNNIKEGVSVELKLLISLLFFGRKNCAALLFI